MAELGHPARRYEPHLIITQEKTKQPLRITITGELAKLMERIRERKATHKIVTAALLTNNNGKRLTAPALRTHFHTARKKSCRPTARAGERHQGILVLRLARQGGGRYFRRPW